MAVERVILKRRKRIKKLGDNMMISKPGSENRPSVGRARKQRSAESVEIVPTGSWTVLDKPM